MPDFQTASPRRTWKQILALAALYAAVNLLAFRLVWMLSEGSEWEYWRQIVGRNFVAGFVASQVAAVSMALVFAHGPFVRRLACWWAVGGALWMSWAIGWGVLRTSFIYGWTIQSEAVWNVLFSLPLTALIVQAPLWALRICLRWRWEREEDAPAVGEVRWSLSEMLISTAVIAVSLALARFLSHERLDFSFWMRWVYFAMYIAPLSLLSVGAAMILTLRRGSWWVGALVFLIHAAMVGIAYIGFRAMTDSFSAAELAREPVFIFLVYIPMFLSFAAGLLAATGTARALGFRLVWSAENSAKRSFSASR
jgi:hypothetical protein